jgi:hypothetical protein
MTFFDIRRFFLLLIKLKNNERGPRQCNGILKYLNSTEDIVVFHIFSVATVVLYIVKVLLILIKLRVCKLYS